MTIIPIKKRSKDRIIAFYQLLCAAFKILVYGEVILVFADETRDSKPTTNDVFFDGEINNIILTIRECIIKSPITVMTILLIIKIAGRLSCYGINADKLLRLKLKQIEG